ncbi:MAG: MoaD/ThiS family protein [Halofilum sp. (in: g-proteobacteria)]|nr:MoaD/ThiS family protein [Halofilum sp. (in: g-proteobacteria)]
MADVWTAVSGEESLPRHVLAAVNLDYAQGETPVSDGDEVAFFPPVTGG